MDHADPAPAHQTPPQKTPRLVDALGLALRGVAMGAADIVPGVSGGTIAFITGIYERFVDALKSLSPAFLAPLARGDVRGATRMILAMHWGVLVPLFGGILFAVLLMSRLITGLMEDQPGGTFAFFFGLILASAWIPFARMNTRGWSHAIAATIAAVGAYLFVGVQPQGLDLRQTNVLEARAPGETVAMYPGKIREGGDLDRILAVASEAGVASVVAFDPKGVLERAGARDNVTVLRDEEALEAWMRARPRTVVIDAASPSLLWIGACGTLSISAMILPGLSGSFLMLLLGQYHNVLSAIGRTVDHAKALAGAAPDPLVALSGHTLVGDALFLGAFGVGVVIGLGVFSRVVSWLFHHFHDLTMAALTGLMLGALRQPGRMVLGHTGGEHGSGWGVAVVAALSGAVIVTGLYLLDSRARSPETRDASERSGGDASATR